MPLFSKPQFKWREPKAFLHIRDAEERASIRWWVRPVAALFITLMVLAQWYVARFNPHKHPPEFHVALVMAILAGSFFAYVFDWIITLCPAEVRLSETHVSRVRGNTNRAFKYADIEYFAWRVTEGITTLVLKRRKAKWEMLIGVPAEISRDDVHLFLLSRDVMPQPGV